MQKYHAFRNVAIGQLPRHPVSADKFLAVSNLPVSVIALGAAPYTAAALGIVTVEQ